MIISYSNFKSYTYCIFFCVAFLFLHSCVPVFSEMQSARLLEKGKHELTAGYSSVSVSDNNDSNDLQDEFGIHYAYGLSDKTNLRFRYVRIMPESGDGDFDANVIGLGPKFMLKKDNIAFYLPIGFAFGEHIEESETWQIHPTFLFTLPLGKNFEFNPSAKALIPVGNDADITVAINLGSGISTDFSKWAIRPEFGFLFDPGEDEYFTHFSIAISVSP